MKFVLISVTIYFIKKAEFDHKNNYKRSQLATFWLMTIS